MNDKNQEILKLSPHKLIAPFVETRFWRNVLIGIALHIVVIGLFSIGYLRATITGEKPAPPAAQNVAPVAAPAATPSPAATASPATAQSTDNSDSPPAAMSEIEKRLEETASPDEIPSEPDTLGIGIDDTRID